MKNLYSSSKLCVEQHLGDHSEASGPENAVGSLLHATERQITTADCYNLLWADWLHEARYTCALPAALIAF